MRLLKIDSFLIHDYFKRFYRTQKRIGFIVPSVNTYNKVIASTRIRCYDMIKYLNQKNIFSELYKKNRKYKIVLFQKTYNDKHIKLAQELKNRGSKIFFDINVNFIEKKGKPVNYIWKKRHENIKKMIALSDTVIVSSEFLLKIYKKYNPNIILIEESILDSFFKQKKIHKHKNIINLVYVGYSAKARELLLIKDALQKLYYESKIQLLLICEKDPVLNIIPYEYIKYNQKKLPELIQRGDIKIAPRDLSNNYNLGHSFTKIAYPMAVGLPVVASPVPSYKGRVAILCEDSDCWYQQLYELIESREKRAKLGNSGREFVKKNFNIEVIGNQYINVLNQYLENKIE